ncbi:MAG TPA: TraR/DksA C4-type zinc finger protein [Cellvibrionaceae bacterium]
MDNAQLAHYKKQLLALREELLDLKETGKDATKTVVLDQSSIGRLSRMDAMQGQAMAQESERRRERQLVEIQKALARIEADDYGYCLECGESINPKRLDIEPTATLCLDCAP